MRFLIQFELLRSIETLANKLYCYHLRAVDIATDGARHDGVLNEHKVLSCIVCPLLHITHAADFLVY